ncbi:hypothetical protein [Streptomyces sp. NPDC005476]|uniref:hypothetical protein n=1 Tax=Streptomyces sp. NPDC005476 TaxID=3156882 RepID=UPI0034537DD5
MLTPGTLLLLAHLLLETANTVLKPAVSALQALRLTAEGPRPRLRVVELLLQVIQLFLEQQDAIMLACAGCLGCPAQLVQLRDLRIGDGDGGGGGAAAADEADESLGVFSGCDGVRRGVLARHGGEEPAEHGRVRLTCLTWLHPASAP